MENFETICGIPAEILSKSFPGVHPNLFKFLFKNNPIIQLDRIGHNPPQIKIEPDLTEIFQNDSAQNPIIKLESIEPVKIEPEIQESQPNSNCIHLGEVQISDLKFEKAENDPEDSTFSSNCELPSKRTPSKSQTRIKQESLIDTSSETPEVEDPPESEVEDDDFSGASSDSSSRSSESDPEATRKLKKPKKMLPQPSLKVKVKCDICQKSYRPTYMRSHKASHLEGVQERVRPYKCPEPGCNKAYFEKCKINWHRKICHNPDLANIKEFECPKCRKKIPKYNSYLSHLKSCEPNQMCEFCPKIFNSKREFQKHRNTHTKEKEYKCGDCDAVFYRSECLLVHRKLHLNERPFPCKRKGCKTSFTTQAQLNNHLKSGHKGDAEGGLACLHCPRKFKKEVTLYVHVNSAHKKERNFLFKCEVKGCGETFSGAGWFQKHQNDKHGGNPKKSKDHLCSKCGKSFDSFVRCSQHELKCCKI